MVQAGNILTVQTDHLDTPRQLTDNTKKVVWNWAYSAFGENQPTNTNNTVFNLRYPGQYYDSESKLHYNINRYYDPATGRYTQSDPIGLSGGINTYTYVGGNSIRWSDRTGFSKRDIEIFDRALKNTVDNLVYLGFRRPGYGYLNGVKNNLNSWCVDGICKSKGYFGCLGQSASMMDALQKLKRDGVDFDDEWRFYILTNGFHNWVSGYSSNPKDGFLTLDPWKGVSSQSPVVPPGFFIPNILMPITDTEVHLW